MTETIRWLTPDDLMPDPRKWTKWKIKRRRSACEPMAERESRRAGRKIRAKKNRSHH